MEASIPAIVLAGGLARRMGGGDKPLRPFNGATLLEAVLARLRPQAAPLLLNANGDPTRFAAFGLPVLPDPVPNHPGPLAGVLAGLEWALVHGYDRVLSVPGDTPFLPPDLLARLRGPAFACASSGGRLHPAVALWPAVLARPLRAELDAGRFRVAGFVAEHGCRPVEWGTMPVDPFLNVNTPADLLLAAGFRATLAADGAAW